ncbi:MAG: hypothetical protein ACXIUD_08170 [Mongoliitalea sp.]
MKLHHTTSATVLAFLFLNLLSSCGKNPVDTHTEGSNALIEIVPVDSVRVENILASLFLFQHATEDYLFFRDAGASKVYVFDRNGDPVFEWAKSGDVPGVISLIADNISLTPEENLVVTDKVNGVMVFSPDGELLYQERVYQYQMGAHGFFTIFRKNQVIQKDGQTYVLHHLDLMDEFQEVSERFYTNRKNLLMTNLSSRQTKQLIPFPEGSKFLSGKAFPFEDFRPHVYFDQQEQKLYLMFQNEPVLYTYSWKEETPVLESSQRLALEGFYENDGLEYAQVRYGVLNGNQVGIPFPSSIESLEKVGDIFLIHYKPGPSPSELADWERVKEGSADESLKASVRQQRQWKTVALMDGNIHPVSRPAMWNDSYRVIGQEIWWMKPGSKDQEDESFTVYRGKLKMVD